MLLKQINKSKLRNTRIQYTFKNNTINIVWNKKKIDLFVLGLSSKLYKIDIKINRGYFD